MAILSRPEAVFGDALIRPTGPGELDVVLDLLAEAAVWLRSSGIEQWHRAVAPAVPGQGCDR